MTTRRTKLEGMLAGNPGDQMLRYMLAMELDKESEHERCLELHRGLMSDAAPYVPSFLMAGQLLSRLGLTSEARATYEAGIRAAKLVGNSHAEGEMTEFLQALNDAAL